MSMKCEACGRVHDVTREEVDAALAYFRSKKQHLDYLGNGFYVQNGGTAKMEYLSISTLVSRHKEELNHAEQTGKGKKKRDHVKSHGRLQKDTLHFVEDSENPTVRERQSVVARKGRLSQSSRRKS
jgi:hypothetical protein